MTRSAKGIPTVDEAATRAKGLVPKTVWVFDLDAPEFREAMLEEGRRLAEADGKDPTIDSFMDAAMRELFEDIDRSEG